MFLPRRTAAAMLAACGLLLAGLPACTLPAGRPAAPQGTQAPALTPVRFGSVFCVCYLGPYVAWKGGFFEKHGIRVQEFVFTEGGARTFEAVSAGNIDFGVLANETVVRGRARGLPVRSIAAVSPEFWALSVRQELRGQVSRVQDLKGRTVAVSAPGSGSWAFLIAIARKSGLDPQRDLQIVPLGNITSIVAGLKAGRVDAAVTWEPGTSQLVLEGSAYTLIDLLDPQQHREVFGAETSLASAVATRTELIERDPELVRRVIAALDEAYAWVKSRRAEEVADLIAPLAGSIDRATLVRSVEETVRTLPGSARPSRAAYDVSVDMLVDTGALERKVPFDEVFDCRFRQCEP